MTLNGKHYEVIRLLGKGKGGYSYLVTDGKGQYVLKQIHHEPCDYYTFGDKLASELSDYETLKALRLSIPRLLDVDMSQERILKEYIEGPVVSDYPERSLYISQVQDMCKILYANGLNIDYFPTNFVLRDGTLFYIDYECNPYDEKWDFSHWGMQYWR